MATYFEKVADDVKLTSEGDAYLMENQHPDMANHESAWISFRDQSPLNVRSIYAKDSAAVIRLEECDQAGKPLQA